MENNQKNFEPIPENIPLVEEYIAANCNDWFNKDVLLDWNYTDDSTNVSNGILNFPTPNNPGEWKFLKNKRKFFPEKCHAIQDRLSLSCAQTQCISESKNPKLIFDVFRKSTGGNPKEVFYYWSGNPVDLPFDMAIDFFTKRIELTANWTAIFTYGKLLFSKEENNSKVSIWHQIYEPIEPFKPRHLLAIYSVNYLTLEQIPVEFKGRQVAVISVRSIPQELAPVKIPEGEPQIILRAVYIVVSNGETTFIYKFDSEDEGGLLFQWVTNFVFWEYIQKEALLTTSYIKGNKGEIEKDYYSRNQL